MLKSYWWKTVLAASLAAAAWGGTFGTVVSIGGEASDLALDETRGVLYIANFTANRIDVMSLASNTVQTSINVAAQPSSIAMSPDGHYLVATNFGNAAAPGSPVQRADGDRSDQSGNADLRPRQRAARRGLRRRWHRAGGHHHRLPALRSHHRRHPRARYARQRGCQHPAGGARQLPARHHRGFGGCVRRRPASLRHWAAPPTPSPSATT